MLILTRRVGETLYIGDDIQVAVLDIRGNQIRIGIEAPRGVNIAREELLVDDSGNRNGAGSTAPAQ